jgi:hypothetical protein
MSHYKEPEKNQARNESITSAVKTLTKDRFRATIARNKYVREVRDYLIKHGSKYDKGFAEELREKEIDQWEQFYLSNIGRKKPRDLKVAYLSGPDPINDLEVLTSCGILPENVWAFESDNKTYDEAIVKALESEFPFIKIYKGKIENYFKILQTKFDIVYLDFCGVITSSQTLSVVRDLFFYQKLNSPGVLITNFALPEENKKDSFWNNLIALSANYLFPKSFTESLTKYGGGFTDSAEASGLSKEKFLSKAHRDPNTFYSQFITRVLFDLPSVIIPYQRFVSNQSLIDTFFRNFKTSELPDDRQEDIICFPNDHSLIWGLNNYIVDQPGFDDLLSKFRRQLSINSDENKLLEAVDLMSFFTGEGIDDRFNSDKLQKICKNWKFTDKYIFCDAFLFHQLKDILIGQLTAPYQYNIAKSKRWTYKAKSTRMFMDLITYDECRYIYDWMPTIDMFEEGVNDISRQLSLRFAIDSIAKQRRWYNDEFLSGTAVIDQGTKGFEAQELKKRKVIN